MDSLLGFLVLKPREFCVMQGVGKLVKILRPLDAPRNTIHRRN